MPVRVLPSQTASPMGRRRVKPRSGTCSSASLVLTKDAVAASRRRPERVIACSSFVTERRSTIDPRTLVAGSVPDRTCSGPRTRTPGTASSGPDPAGRRALSHSRPASRYSSRASSGSETVVSHLPKTIQRPCLPACPPPAPLASSRACWHCSRAWSNISSRSVTRAWATPTALRSCSRGHGPATHGRARGPPW